LPNWSSSFFQRSEVGRDAVEASGCSLCLDVIDLATGLGEFFESPCILLRLRQVGNENGKSVHYAAQLTTVALRSDNLPFGVRSA
jgi:hypothetical protein